MASDIPEPQDDSHLHDDPAEWARLWQQIADEAWRDGHADAFTVASETANKYRRMARRGERVPRF